MSCSHMLFASDATPKEKIVFFSRLASHRYDMFVGVLRLEFHIPGARSLKDKRQVIRSFRDRVRARFDVSIAEIDALDALQRAVFAVAVVSRDSQICDQVLADVAALSSCVRDALLVERTTELVSFKSLQSSGFAEKTAFDD